MVMAQGNTHRSVILAIVGNGVISALKLAVFFVSGSGTMLAEGIHSVADTMNQALLFLGLRLASRPPDEDHPFGYGAEQYFWALVSAMGIFVLGCGVTVYHGVHGLMHPALPTTDWMTWLVLGLSGSIEGSVFVFALLEVRRRKGAQGWLAFVKQSSDPTLLAVLFEDAIAVTGNVIAAIALGLCEVTGLPIFDAVGSIVIGLMLGALAIVLAMKNKSLLIGRAASPAVEERIRRLVIRDPAVARIISMRTRVIAAGVHSIDLQVDFDADAIIDRLWREVAPDLIAAGDEGDAEKVARVFGRRLIDELAVEVDRLEAAIQREVPSAKLIDIEGD